MRDLAITVGRQHARCECAAEGVSTHVVCGGQSGGGDAPGGLTGEGGARHDVLDHLRVGRARESAGMRSRAMTATAPASSAMRACRRSGEISEVTERGQRGDQGGGGGASSVSTAGRARASSGRARGELAHLLAVDHVHDDAALLEDGEGALDGGVDVGVLGGQRAPRREGRGRGWRLGGRGLDAGDLESQGRVPRGRGR